MGRQAHAAMRIEEGSSATMGLSIEVEPERVTIFLNTSHKRAGLLTWMLASSSA